jgi:hypothetical protein
MSANLRHLVVILVVVFPLFSDVDVGHRVKLDVTSNPYMWITLSL